jgi:hypothetical protein
MQGQCRRGEVIFLLGCIWHWRDSWGKNSQHKFWWGCRPWERAPGADATHARTIGAWAARPLRGADLSATWCLGLGKRVDWLWQPQRHVVLRQPNRQVFVSHCYYNIITYNKNTNIYTTTNNILVFISLIINKIIIFLAQIILFFIWIF